MTIGWHFDNTYSKLSNTFKEDIKPTPVHEPELVILNNKLAEDLSLNFSKIDKISLDQLFSGNSLPKDAEKRDLSTGDIGRLYSGRGEVALKIEVTDKVKEGIVFTTFHFPEHMVNMVTGHGKDEETMCAEYKVSSVEIQKISNQFKTIVEPKENQAEVS